MTISRRAAFVTRLKWADSLGPQALVTTPLLPRRPRATDIEMIRVHTFSVTNGFTSLNHYAQMSLKNSVISVTALVDGGTGSFLR